MKRSILFLVGLFALAASPARPAGIDSRLYSCAQLHALIAAQGFVFISQATFGDFVVANASFCGGGDVIETRSVATADQPECPVNYCNAYTSSEGH